MVDNFLLELKIISTFATPFEHSVRWGNELKNSRESGHIELQNSFSQQSYCK